MWQYKFLLKSIPLDTSNLLLYLHRTFFSFLKYWDTEINSTKFYPIIVSLRPGGKFMHDANVILSWHHQPRNPLSSTESTKISYNIITHLWMISKLFNSTIIYSPPATFTCSMNIKVLGLNDWKTCLHTSHFITFKLIEF